MNSVLAFAPRPRPTPDPRPASTGTAGAIIIFPGVRYERRADWDSRNDFAAPTGTPLPRQQK